MTEATFRQKVLSILSDNRYDRFVSGKRTGKVDNKKLFRIAYSDKVFKKREARKNKEYAVSLLIDCSGSMNEWGQEGNRASVAAICAEKLYNALEIAGVKVEVRGFNTFPGYAFKRFKDRRLPSGTVEKAVLKEARDGTRFLIETSTRTFIPAWDERYKPLENGLRSGKISYHDYHSSVGPQGNCDGEAVAFARGRLLQEKGQKILFVLSDGQPSFDCGMNYISYHNPKKKYDDYALKGEIDQTIKEGITVFGIGIQTSAVTAYYPKENVEVVNSLENLYPVVVDRLQKLIKRG